MNKKISQLIHLFGPHTGLHVIVNGNIRIWQGVASSVEGLVSSVDNGREKIYRVYLSDIKPIVHHLKDIRDEHLFKIGEMICHIPKSGSNYAFESNRTSNTVGGIFRSSEFVSDEYFSIFHEQNGYIENGWFSEKDGKDNTIKRRHWRTCSFHDVTLYLLQQHYWLWEDEYFEKGLVLNSKTALQTIES